MTYYDVLTVVSLSTIFYTCGRVVKLLTEIRELLKKGIGEDL